VRPKGIFKVLLRYGISIITDEEGPELPVFEFDPVKNAADRVYHGIDFVAAQALWLDDRRIEIDARSSDEPRRVLVARLGHRHWAAIYAWRGGRVRLISVRRARFREIRNYEREEP
jgi:uncharacterized protein